MVAKSDWVSGDKFGAADANAVAAEMNEKVPWQGGMAGVLPATSGQKLRTQGGNTLDDGAGNVVIKGGTLDGVVIGGTAQATSISAKTITALAPSSQTIDINSSNNQLGVWLYQHQSISGNCSVGGAGANVLSISDRVNNTSGGGFSTLQVTDYILSPATGGRTAISGFTDVVSVSGAPPAGSGYIGVSGRAITGANLTGTEASLVGSLWGGWFTAGTTGGTYHQSVMGIEVDVQSMSNVINAKIGVRICLGTISADTVRGTNDDVALQIIKAVTPPTMGWGVGIKFGTDQWGSGSLANISGSWPFDDTSTMIGTSKAGNGLPVNIGIDFSNVTFTGPAIKLPGASIAMAPMPSAPAAVAGEGMLYVATDGSLHYRGATTDTQVAPA